MTKQSDVAEKPDPAAVAREPRQERARQRFEAILREAEAILQDEGLSGFSIPVLAEKLDMTRGSIYSYFPTPYALLNELAERYLDRLESLYVERADELARLSWRKAIIFVVDQAVDFYSQHPVARLLILGGAVTDESYRAQEMTIKRLGDLARGMLENKGLTIPTDPDVATLTTDIGVSCFRRSFIVHGRITTEYKETAIIAMQSFLKNYIVKSENP